MALDLRKGRFWIMTIRLAIDTLLTLQEPVKVDRTPFNDILHPPVNQHSPYNYIPSIHAVDQA